LSDQAEIESRRRRALVGDNVFTDLDSQRKLNIVTSSSPLPSDFTDAKDSFENVRRRIIRDARVKPSWLDQSSWDAILDGRDEGIWPILSKMYDDGQERAYGGVDEDGYVGDDEPHNNMQPYLALNYIIKVDATAKAAFVDGLDLSLSVSALSDTEDDATYEDGDILVYHGGQTPEPLNKWKSFKLFDGFTGDLTNVDLGFKFYMPGATGSLVGPRGAFVVGSPTLKPANKTSVMAMFGDVELGALGTGDAHARLLSGSEIQSPTTPLNSLDLSNGTDITTSTRFNINNVISSMTNKDAGVFGQDTSSAFFSVGRGGQGAGVTGASAEGTGALSNKKYEEILRVTETGRLGLLTDGSGLDSNAANVVYGSGYTASGNDHSGMHINGGLRLRRGAVVVDGITTDISKSHTLEDNEIPTSGAVRDYVDSKLDADPQANTIKAMASGVFRLDDIVISGGKVDANLDDHPWVGTLISGDKNYVYTIDLNNLVDTNTQFGSQAVKIGTFDASGATAAIMIQPCDITESGFNNRAIHSQQCIYKHRGAGNHNLVDVYSVVSGTGSDATAHKDHAVQIFAQQMNV